MSHTTLAQVYVRVNSSMFHVFGTLCASANEELGTLAENSPLTGYEHNFFAEYHFSETTEIFIQESSNDTSSSNLHDSKVSNHRKSALFTTVHSGARRTSGP